MVYLVKSPVKKSSLLSVVAMDRIDAVAEKKTDECFLDGSRYAYRDPCLDFGLPPMQPEKTSCAVTVFAPLREATAAEFALLILGIPFGIPLEEIEVLLIGRGLTMALTQLEAVVEKSADVNAKAFCFVENRGKGVGIVFIDRNRDDNERFDVLFDRILDRTLFTKGDRLLICNNGHGVL